MKLFGFEITKKALQPVSNRGWFPIVAEPTSGAWQRSEPIVVETALAHSAVFACVNLIASDVAKLPISISRRTDYWSPITHEYSRLLRKPNGFQNRVQFISQWIASKLIFGNTYVLKVRDNRGRITALHVLDAKTVRPMIADDGAVFYELKASQLSGIAADVTVPAREIIHDRGIAPFHPLIGLSPLQAAAAATTQGLAIQHNSAKFFQNGAQPGGILTAPGAISPETAERLKAHWDANYTGANAGKTAVLGDGLRYEAMSTTPVDSQLIEQLAFSAQDVARAFHVPAWKIGAGPTAPYTSSEATNLQYLSDCLQVHIESLELALDDGLDLPPDVRTEFDESSLLRLDSATRINVLSTAVKSGLRTINEARAELNLAPVDGGDEIFRQMQDVPLAPDADLKEDAQ
ncbi:phage portal protein [Aromatoleum aromaticum]|uniref:Phage portal protein n=1 Tax=Aromatoleum aromaticum (strain DSM 19018 / LMG 30748 / EbN1) TaxID=76114 RepID=Q5P0B7_AROAE|nr:phage portal protein [Aromatoleum aromaticum]NMG56723.1 phage portal protein [Aromatoleum aromaticum]CAI09247.1 putative phage portal protein [Aromatoleum aromaticum EbN1]